MRKILLLVALLVFLFAGIRGFMVRISTDADTMIVISETKGEMQIQETPSKEEIRNFKGPGQLQ